MVSEPMNDRKLSLSGRQREGSRIGSVSQRRSARAPNTRKSKCLGLTLSKRVLSHLVEGVVPGLLVGEEEHAIAFAKEYGGENMHPSERGKRRTERTGRRDLQAEAQRP
jgi:hypothetical protein